MTHRDVVLNLLREFGALSDYSLVHAAKARHFDVTPSSVRSRRAELVREGIVRDSGSTESTGRGRTAKVWTLA